MTAPLNIWYSDGVQYVDYRREDGQIVTLSTHQLITEAFARAAENGTGTE